MKFEQELELVSYIKERVKFEEDLCSSICKYNSFMQDSCDLFGENISYNVRCDQCKRFFD